MGADGRIVDASQPIRFEIRCHSCSTSIEEYEPRRYHEKCVQPDGSLLVSIDADNYEER